MDLLKDIKYIFQVPLEWFKKVDVRVFGDHPGSGIMFEDSNDGSRAIMLDFHVLDDRYSSSGSVSSVDNVGPDANGNVELNAITEDFLDGNMNIPIAKIASIAPSKWVKSDSNGKLTTTNDNPVTASSSDTGFVYNTTGSISYVTGKSGTTTINVVTGISWNGVQIVATNSRLTYVDGLLTSVTSLNNTVINTVTY